MEIYFSSISLSMNPSIFLPVTGDASDLEEALDGLVEHGVDHGHRQPDVANVTFMQGYFVS